MLDQRLGCWPNKGPATAEYTMFEGKLSYQYICWVSCFAIPAVINSVSLQTQLRTARSQGYNLVELLAHRCRSSIYGLAIIWTQRSTRPAARSTMSTQPAQAKGKAKVTGRKMAAGKIVGPDDDVQPGHNNSTKSRCVYVLGHSFVRRLSR